MGLVGVFAVRPVKSISLFIKVSLTVLTAVGLVDSEFNCDISLSCWDVCCARPTVNLTALRAGLANSEFDCSNRGSCWGVSFARPTLLCYMCLIEYCEGVLLL